MWKKSLEPSYYKYTYVTVNPQFHILQLFHIYFLLRSLLKHINV